MVLEAVAAAEMVILVPFTILATVALDGIFVPVTYCPTASPTVVGTVTVVVLLVVQAFVPVI